MRERNLLDDIDEIELSRKMTTKERFLRGLELSELAFALARAGNPDAEIRSEPLEEKARLWTLRRLEAGR